MTQETTVLDLRHRSHDPELLARMVWQQLFAIYREQQCPLDDMDSLLCDLTHLGRIIKDLQNGGKKKVWYWACQPEGSFTNLDTTPGYLYEVVIEFDLDKNEILFTWDETSRVL